MADTANSMAAYAKKRGLLDRGESKGQSGFFSLVFYPGSLPVPLFTALLFPAIGIVLMLLIITLPRYFPWFSAAFAAYSLLILYLTA
jgi:hypothetical protein